MTYGCSFNLFLKDDKEITDNEKVDKLKEYEIKDLLTLLRNIEESPRSYTEEVIKGVHTCLFNKGIMCI